VIYLTFYNANPTQLRVATSTATGAGGFVNSVGGSWASGSGEDVVFGVDTKNLLAVDPGSNSAQSPVRGGWGCSFVTTFSAIQVDWSTLLVNTGYFGHSTTVNVVGGCAVGTGAPYGVAAQCGYNNANAYINLTGTQYFVNEGFVPDGYLPSGRVLYSSANKQVFENYGTGDCGYLLSNSADVALQTAGLGEGAVLVTGGWYLQLGRLASP